MRPSSVCYNTCTHIVAITIPLDSPSCSSPQSCCPDVIVDLVFCGNKNSYLLALARCTNIVGRLAATLGARSSFKKLPKRDVMGADIIQLCGLITEPAEPLALRLSSNLMVGVAR